MLKCGLLLCLLVVTATCRADNIVELAQKLGLNELVTLVTKAGLGDTLANKGPFTVFAPTDEAFASIPKYIVHRIVNNMTELTDLLTFHVVSGTVKSTDLSNELLAESLFAKHSIRINIYDLGQSKAITADGSRVVKPDNLASNGVIHVVDRVLFPIPEGSVTDLVVKDPMLSTLLTAVQKANLGGVLGGPGNFTVFAPTNKAFANLPPGELQKLLANVTALTDILKYHVVPATVYSEGLKPEQDVPTLEGKTVHVTKKGVGHVEVNNARVEIADIPVTNGVVHVIDAVLVPSQN